MNVAVLMGGPSAEREISIRSGTAVADGLRAAGHRVTVVDVRDAGFPLPDGVEAVFVALHGTFGEDGGVQRELQRRGVPFTGAGAAASAVAFDKRLSKRQFDRHGIPTPSWEMVRRGQSPTIGWPLVVKPPCQGSSLGIRRVNGPDQWAAALDEALKYDREAMVERFIEGRELTVGIVDGEALPVLEIIAPGGWYDFKAKYGSGQTSYLAPAPLTAEQTAVCRRMALEVYRVLEVRGFGRADFRMQPDGTLMALELNTIPGFTATSLLPKAARCAGIEFTELCDRILKTAFTPLNPEP